MTRPAIANERLALNRAGQVVLKTPGARTQRQAASQGHSERAGQRQYPSAGDHGDAPPPSASARLSWARLLNKTAGSGFERRTQARKAKAREGFRKRVFQIDLEHCPHCGGPLKITAIVDSTRDCQHLSHLGLPGRAPPRAAGRAFDGFQQA